MRETGFFKRQLGEADWGSSKPTRGTALWLLLLLTVLAPSKAVSAASSTCITFKGGR